MKLIVLYGKPNTGKTTSLKICYEVLKGLNLEETNVFEYLDLNRYLDFLDVLTLDSISTKTFISSITKSSETPNPLVAYNNNDIYKLEKELNNLESNTIDVSLTDDYREKLNKKKRETTISTEGKKKIGIELEGDYGENNKSIPTLEERLEQLKNKNCDIIICACRNTRSPIKSLLNSIKMDGDFVYLIPTSPSRDCKSYAAKVLYVLKCIL